MIASQTAGLHGPLLGSGKPVEPVGPRVGTRTLGLRDVRLEPGPGACRDRRHAQAPQQ